MTKYDEIMNRIELTPDARERIMTGVIESIDLTGDKFRTVKMDKDRLKRARIRKYLTVAACLVLLIAGSYGISRTDIFNEFVSDISGGDAAFEMAEEAEEAATRDLNLDLG